MSTRVQWRRGNTAQTAVFTGAVAEITVDTDKNVIVVHDGVTTGGYPAPTLTFTQSAYNTANAAFASANNVAPQVQPAYNTANAAFEKANAGYIIAQGAYDAANNVFPQIQPSFNTANAAFIHANGAFDQANSAYTAAQNANNYAGAVDVYAQGAFAKANTNATNLTAAGSYANSAYGQANTATAYAQSAGNYANAAFAQANTTATDLTAAGSYANSAYAQANTGTILAQGAYNQANTNATNLTAAGSYANSAYGQANTATLYATSAGNYANAAFETANNALPKAGGTMTGALIINTGTSESLNTSGPVYVGSDLSVKGNIYLTGSATQYNANVLVIQDPIIYLADNNSGDSVEIGFYGSFTGNGSSSFSHYQHTGLIRDHTDRKWKLFSNVPEPESSNSYVDFTNAIYDTLKVGNIEADVANINGYNLFSYTSGAFNQANSAFSKANSVVQNAFVTVTANNTSLSPTSNNDTLTITAAVANGISVLAGNKTVDFGLRPSGVTSGWYGGSTQIPSINVDSFGRIVSVANNTVSTTISLAGGSGSGSVSGGGTLTVSGGTGITTSVSSSTITVTNSGVTSFNGATGSVTFGSLDVTNALTYTPANKAGDTLSGNFTGISNLGAVSLTVNTSGYITTTSVTTPAAASAATVDSFATATYRSAKYLAQMTAGSRYHVIELRLVHNGTTVYMAQYGEIYTGSSLGTFDASIATGTLSLTFTPATATATTVKLIREAIVV